MSEIKPLPFNRKNATPSVQDIFNLIKKDIMLAFNCMHIGTVQNFDKTNQTAEISINYQKTFYSQNPDGTYSTKNVAYPTLKMVPCVRLSGGKVALKMPISRGDQCAVFFNDRDMMNWWAGATTGSVASARLHSFSDAIAVVGIGNLQNLLTGYEDNKAVLGDLESRLVVGDGASSIEAGQTVVKVESKILIKNQSENLNSIMQEILTQLQSLTTAISTLTVTGVTSGPGTSGVPANAATIISIGTQLGSLATRLGGLLE